MSLTAEYRPAVRTRRFAHDDLIAVDLFSGFGGLTQGIEKAGFTTIMAANHNRYKVQVHEANHPNAQHWIADLVDPDSADYHSARDLPAADLLVAGVSCVNHSQANTQKAYAQRVSLFDLDDPDFEARVTRSERDRATANCVLAYADQHHPRMILVECTTELQSWGPAIPGNPKVGDGSTYRWWLKRFENLGYRYRVLYLNSMFFGVGQSRDRLYIAFWDKAIPAPDLDHRPPAWCPTHGQVESVWTWRTGVPPTGSVRYGKQYEHRCPSCRQPVTPAFTPSLHALDLTDLGTRIGDRKKPLRPATMARAERCRQRFGQFPAILMPAKAERGSPRHVFDPMATQTSQQETALLHGGVIAAHRHNGDGQNITRPMDTVTTTQEKALLLAVNNYQGAPRGVGEALPTQGGSETLSLLSAGVMPYRKNTIPATHAEAMPTQTADQTPGLLTTGILKAAGNTFERPGSTCRTRSISEPLWSQTATNEVALLAGWFKQNGSHGVETAPHPITDPLGTLTARDTTGLLAAEWCAMIAELRLEDCYFRMLREHEIGRGCGFDVDFPGHTGTFIVWGKARDQVDGFGNAVTPAVGEWIGLRLRAALHGSVAA